MPARHDCALAEAGCALSLPTLARSSLARCRGSISTEQSAPIDHEAKRADAGAAPAVVRVCHGVAILRHEGRRDEHARGRRGKSGVTSGIARARKHANGLTDESHPGHVDALRERTVAALKEQ